MRYSTKQRRLPGRRQGGALSSPLKKELDQIFEDQRRYRLVRKIADGGMGSVYEAVQYGAEGFEKRVAVKTILPSFLEREEFLRLFIGEAKLVANLVHENICQVYHLGKWGDTYYIAMEFVEGINLAHFIDDHLDLGDPLPIELGAFIASRICRALEYAHAKRGLDARPLGLVHRDISPTNVLLNFEGVTKLTDFGVAKAFRVMEQDEGRVLMGKVRYMSPEQASYGATDARSDIFSLGIVMYELLTGHILFGDETAEVLDQIRDMEIPDPRHFRTDLPEALVQILLRALERRPLDRYQSAGDMGYDLEYYMYHDRYGPTNQTLGAYLKQRFLGSPPDAARSRAVEEMETWVKRSESAGKAPGSPGRPTKEPPAAD
jgi:serine/threonine-protein kinase